MGRTRRPSDLHLSLDRGAPVLLRAQLVAALADAIAAGRLRAGAELPATRTLAADLGVSRGVVVQAYGELQERGLLVTRGRALPRVADVRRPGDHAEPAREAAVRLDLAPGVPDLGLFPRRAWLDALRYELAAAPDRALAGADPGGAPARRLALADFLARTRGADAGAERVIACQGATQAIEVACRLLVGAGCRVLAVEDPCAPAALDAARRAGLRVVPAPVDAGGLRVDALPAADAVLVSPGHQQPTGVVLAAERRRALVASGLVLIEDDRGAELRLDGRAPAVLQADAPERVLLVGSASRVLAPGLRCGWLVVPPALARAALAVRASLDGGSPAPEGLALARLLETAAYERQLRRARAEYARRRDALAAALAARFGAEAVGAHGAGLHLELALPEPLDRAALAARAAAGRVRLATLEEHLHARPPYAQALLLGHARVPPAAANEAARAVLAVVLGEAAAAAPRPPLRRPARPSRDRLHGAPGEGDRTLRVLALDVRGAEPAALPSIVAAIGATDADVVLLQNTSGRTGRIAQALGWPHAVRALSVTGRVRLVRPGSSPFVLAEVAGGRVAAIANLHLSEQSYGPAALLAGASRAAVDAVERRLRVPEIEAALAPLLPLAAAGVPVIVGGTVNAPCDPGWPAADAIRAAGLSDVWRELRGDLPGVTWPVPGSVVPPGHGADRIDAIYVGGPATPRVATLVGEEGGRGVDLPLPGWTGDHRGVLATIDVVAGVVAPCVAALAPTATVGQPVRVALLGSPVPAGARVSLVPGVAGRGRATTWRAAAEAAADGALALPTAGLRPGGYDVVLDDGRGRELSRAPVWIAAHGAVPRIATSRRRYPPGEPIAVSWTDAPGNTWDWIGVYPLGGDTEGADPLAYRFTDARPAGTTTIPVALERGRYLVGLFLDDTGTLLAVDEVEIR